jgi:antitoxin component YwqK of YwqJK toxin-antitoxin module
MNTLEDYTRFVLMTEDAISTQNTTKMKWLSLEARRQLIHRDMIFLENALQTSKQNPSYKTVCNEYEDSIRANLQHMKHIITEIRLDQKLNEQLRQIEGMTQFTVLKAFMEEEVYQYYNSGNPMDQLPFPIKKTLHDKLKIVLDETI